jgi:SHS2 domain-containing protein
LPHTADLFIEAWGGDFSACAEEAVAGLLDVCMSGTPESTSNGPIVRMADGPIGAVLEAILEEVVFVLDTSDAVPVDVRVATHPDGTVELNFGLAPRGSVHLTGAAPKAVVMLEAPTGAFADSARCRFIVDV